MCGQLESTYHIIYGYVLAHFFWCFGREVFGWAIVPDSVPAFQAEIIEVKSLSCLYFLSWLRSLVPLADQE